VTSLIFRGNDLPSNVFILYAEFKEKIKIPHIFPLLYVLEEEIRGKRIEIM
jgi:hypothetical protein